MICEPLVIDSIASYNFKHVKSYRDLIKYPKEERPWRYQDDGMVLVCIGDRIINSIHNTHLETWHPDDHDFLINKGHFKKVAFVDCEEYVINSKGQLKCPMCHQDLNDDTYPSTGAFDKIENDFKCPDCDLAFTIRYKMYSAEVNVCYAK